MAAVRLDSIVDKPVRLDSLEQPVRLDSIEPVQIPPAPDMSITDPTDITIEPITAEEPSVTQPPSSLMPGTVLGGGTPQAIRADYDRSEQVFTSEELLAGQDAFAEHEAFLKSPVGKLFGLDATLFDKTATDRLNRTMGRVAYLGTKLATGLTLHTPELVFGPDLAERIHKGVSGFEMAPSEKTVGEMTEFVGGLMTAGKLVKPLVNLMPAREALKLMTGGGATFMLRNLSEQTVDRLRKGESVSGNELLAETITGAAFGAARRGGRQLDRYIRWSNEVRNTPGFKDIPRRLWFRVDESLRAAAEGMPEKVWNKLYAKDVADFGKAAADAFMPLRQRLPGFVPDVQGFKKDADVAWKTAGYQPLAKKGGYKAPARKRLTDITAKSTVPEPHLFLPMTQLMKRVPTPGVIQPKRRVLVPQPTALAAVKKWERLKGEKGPSGKPLDMPRNPIVKWSLDYMHARNSDIERIYGFNPGFVPKDPSFVRRRGDVLRTMAKSQEKYAKRYQKKLDAGVEPRNINTLNPAVSARYMWMQIDDRYGVPVWLVANHMYDDVGLGVFEADAAVRDAVQARHLVGITKADDEKIADWLNSNDTRRNILAKSMSADSLMLAAKEDDLLQGALAHEMKMMIAGRWIDTGDVPLDIKNYIPNKAMAKGFTERVLREAKAADDAGTLLEHVTNVEPWKSGMGVRRNYYMSSPDESDVVDDTMFKMGIGVFEAPPDKANLPGTYSYEAKPRRGMPKRKGGSTLNNIYNKYTRVAAMNRARKDMRILSDRLRYVQMSAADKSSLNLMLNNMLHKSTIPKRGFALPIKIKRAYWTTSFSPLVRPGTAIYRIIRNSPQNIAFGPFGISMPKALRHARILTENRGKLHELDPEMMKRFDRNFSANVSQRKAMWTEFYMQDVAKITQDFDRRALTNKAIGILEASGTGYMAVDEFSRKCIWMTEYQIVKEAMQEFLSGKINQNQFYNITKLDTVHRQQQLLVHDMVSNGQVDDMAELAADWLTEDTNMAYKTEKRSLIEQSPEERVFFSPITFNRGRLEHGYYRGVRAFIDGVSEGNHGKAYRGATNLIKGYTMSALVSTALLAITGKKAYDFSSQFTFGLLDPGTSKFHKAAQQSGYNIYKYSKGEQGLMQTIDNVADAWATVGESLFIPFSIEMANIYESVKDKGGVTIYRLIRNGVASKLGIDVKEFDNVSRTRQQAIVHALWGSEEYPKKEPVVEGRGTRGTRGTRDTADE